MMWTLNARLNIRQGLKPELRFSQSLSGNRLTIRRVVRCRDLRAPTCKADHLFSQILAWVWSFRVIPVGQYKYVLRRKLHNMST